MPRSYWREWEKPRILNSTERVRAVQLHWLPNEPLWTVSIPNTRAVGQYPFVHYSTDVFTVICNPEDVFETTDPSSIDCASTVARSNSSHCGSYCLIPSVEVWTHLFAECLNKCLLISPNGFIWGKGPLAAVGPRDGVFDTSEPSGYFMYCQVLHSQIPRSAHTAYLCVLCGSQNK